MTPNVMSQSIIIISCFLNEKITKKKGIKYAENINAKNISISLLSLLTKKLLLLLYYLIGENFVGEK